VAPPGIDAEIDPELGAAPGTYVFEK